MNEVMSNETWEQQLPALAAQRVIAMDGSSVRVRQAWGEKPVVHIFLRQFGCLFCHQMVQDVIGIAPEVVERGGHVVLLGCGSHEQMHKFAQQKGIPRDQIALYCDPGRKSYDAAGLDRSFMRTFFNADSLQAFTRANSQSHVITGVRGDVAQLGGVFVIAPPAQLLYEHRSRFAGDHPAPDEILDALPKR